jgi:KH-domain-like of EngA bacterial GTPase enzymes, C-terminal
MSDQPLRLTRPTRSDKSKFRPLAAVSTTDAASQLGFDAPIDLQHDIEATPSFPGHEPRGEELPKRWIFLTPPDAARQRPPVALAVHHPGQHPPADLPDSYRRYLVNALRETFDLPGTPIRMMLRKGKNPYDAR